MKNLSKRLFTLALPELVGQADAHETEPHIHITQPAPGTVSPWWAGAFITARVDHDVKQVTFYIDGEATHVDAEPSYHFVWKEATPGWHELKAVAENADGSLIEATSRFLITSGGHLDFTAPEPYQSFEADEAIRLNVMAADPDGGILEVSFYANGEKIGEVVDPREEVPEGTPLEHEFVWVNPPAGVHRLEARATDAAGNEIQSFSRWVYAGVSPPDPNIQIIRPSQGTHFDRSDTVAITVDAVDPHGEVLWVDFFSNGSVIGQQGMDLDAGWIEPGQVWRHTFHWLPETAGAKQITARFRRNDATSVESDPVTIFVADDSPPQPRLQVHEPNDLSVYVDPALVTFKLTAFFPSGLVEHAEIFADGELLGTALHCPLNANCPSPQPGTHVELKHFVAARIGSLEPVVELGRGFHTIVARARVPGTVDEVIESDPINIAIWRERPSIPVIQLMQADYHEVFSLGQSIPLLTRAVMSEGHLHDAEVLVNGRRIGYAASCPPNAFCGPPPDGQVSTLLTFYQDGGEIIDWGHWKGAEPGLHHVTIRGLTDEGQLFESEPHPLIVTNREVTEEPTFVLPVTDTIYEFGEPIPIKLRVRVPDEGLAQLEIAANGERIGWVSDCPPNADCGPPPAGSIVLLDFYPNEINGIEDWGSAWLNVAVGRHELAVLSADPDTGEFTQGDTISITVQPPALRLQPDGKGILQLRLNPGTAAPNLVIESSADLIQWQRLAPVPADGILVLGGLIRLLPSEQYFRVSTTAP